LNDALSEGKKVKIQGVIFVIRKLSALDHLTGAKVLTQHYDTYKVDKKTPSDPNVKAIKEHFRDVFMACVISPKLSRKDEAGATSVDELFNNWDMANELYGEIIVYTYGKKKIRQMFKALAN